MMSFLSGQGEEEKPLAEGRDRRSADSSSFAIGTATFVVALAAVVGLALDRPPSPADRLGAGWHLRGALSATAPRDERG